MMTDTKWILCIVHGGGAQRCAMGLHETCTDKATWYEDDRGKRHQIDTEDE